MKVRNDLTQQFDECFKIEEIECWKISGNLPQGKHGTISKWKEKLERNDVPERWRDYNIDLTVK